MFTVLMSQGQGGIEVGEFKTLDEALLYVLANHEHGSHAIRYPDGSFHQWIRDE